LKSIQGGEVYSQANGVIVDESEDGRVRVVQGDIIVGYFTDAQEDTLIDGLLRRRAARRSKRCH